ncbi:hypothetical protein [Streptomyces showdoensis]|uniref:AG2 protein n=1 Tax=Streptomyces showdoensis TaxID=68268 RepID=A0A2P2GGL2_STREW|nr:hypothetical protein [Streptomyces showdoensis]KKZ69999.1 hypothetical protein VO63_31160 [Streptomyces showdoensis]
MLTYDNVFHAPLDKMKAAADGWSEMKGKLEKLAEDARTTMAAKARDEYWRGVNAEVTKPFVDKTAKEFEDAAKAAGGIHRILQSGYDAFSKAKGDLLKIVDTDAPAHGFRVSAEGKVEAREPLLSTKDPGLRHDPGFQDLVRKERAAIDAWQRRIDAILETCDDADIACANALKANITGDKHNFSAPKYDSLDAEEAQRAVDLAKKGREISHAELVELNELLGDNSGSKDFSRGFYDGLGPKGALEFFGQLSTDTYDYSKVDKQRLEDVQALQKNMGLNLATATQGGDGWTQKWSAEMRMLGTDRIPLAKYDNNPAFGYQLLGGIMRYGNYDPKFLVPIAEHVTQLHAKDPYTFAGNRNIGGWLKNPFNPSGVNGAGYDPMVSMLEALGHSPDAAKRFFTDAPTSYNADGTPGGKVDLDPKADGEQFTSYLDFFQGAEYDFFPDFDGHDPDEAEKTAANMPDALGHALEAATTGHAWDDPNPVLRRDEESAEIMREVINDYGTDSELRKRHESMIDSLGNMGAAYIDDLNYSTYGFGGSGENTDRDKLFRLSSDGKDHTDFGQVESLRFMTAVAGDEGAYRSMSAAQQVFEASGLKAMSGDRAEGLEFAHNATKMHGILDESRINQIAQDFKDDEDQRNLELEQQAEWRKTGVSSGVAAVVGVGSAVVLGPAAGLVAVTAVPLVMEAVGSSIDTAYATDTLQYLKDNEYDNDDEALNDIEGTRQAGKRSAVVPLLNYAESVGMSMEERRDMFREAEYSYNAGVTAAGGRPKVA